MRVSPVAVRRAALFLAANRARRTSGTFRVKTVKVFPNPVDVTISATVNGITKGKVLTVTPK
jgi:hypothetical protein